MNPDEILLNQLNGLCKSNGVTMIPVKTENFIFEENVHLNCFYCGRYNNSWRCPPKIPDLDFIKIINEFEFHAFVYNRYEITPQNEHTVRVDSTNHLHKTLLAMEKLLYENGRSKALSFIGGSCKLCKNGCGENRCNSPYAARIPLEATGMNIEKSAEKYGIEIVWPVSDHMTRIGMLMW